MILVTDLHSDAPADKSLSGNGGLVWILCTLLFLAVSIFSWGRLNHYLIDFGRELYVPWRLVEGDQLYRDIAYFNGPFSPVFNSLVFRVGGVNCQSLFLANSILAYGVLVIILQQARRFAGNATAAVCGIVFILVFAFNHAQPMGIFSYISPYSHEMTHGLLLSLLSILALGSPVRHELTAKSNRLLRLALAGVLGGLVFLTKPEIFAALMPGWLGWWLASLRRQFVPEQRQKSVVFIQEISTITISCLTVVAVAAVWFSRTANAIDVLGGWIYMTNEKVRSNPFYRSMLGLEMLPDNIQRQLLQASGVLAVVGSALAWDYWWNKGKEIYLLAGLLCTAHVLVLFFWTDAPLIFFSGISAVLGGIVLITLIHSSKPWKADTEFSTKEFQPSVEGLPWLFFASGMLVKILLFPSIVGYGFVLALPACMVMLVACVLITKSVSRRFWDGGNIAVGVVLAAAMFDAYLMGSNNLRKISGNNQPMGEGFDQMLVTSPKFSPESTVPSDAIVQAIEEVKTVIPPESTLVVMPEGIIVNYFARRKSSIRITNFMPIEIAMFGEEGVLKELQDTPPDFVLLVDRDTADYQDQFGSKTYGGEILEWIEGNYSETKSFGAPLVRRGPGGARPGGARLMKFNRNSSN